MIRVTRMMPVPGVGVMGLTYLITGNPISAVLYGLQSVSQLPSH